MSLTDQQLAQLLQDEELAKQLDEQLNTKNNPKFVPPFPHPKPIPRDPFEAIIQKVVGMTHDNEATHLAGKYGLTINNVVWEDTARTKFSSYGPNISDVTLQVKKHRMPIIRSPNYTDLTWDVPLEKIPLVVGNEVSDTLRYTTTLKDYLENFKSYLHDASSWSGSRTSLLATSGSNHVKDSHAIMSSQACFLPVPKEGEAKFNAAIFNYQSSVGNPAVLAIVATSKGTSAQIVENPNGYEGQKLFFNNNGKKCSFIAQRLSDHRKENHDTNTSKQMTQEEKQDNMIMIIQVPLKYTETRMSMLDEDECIAFSAPCAESACFKKSRSSGRQVNVEDAIIKVGKSEGKFEEIKNLAIERDSRFPIRITLQFYKCTDNGAVNDDVMSTISKQITDSRKKADFVGSLVITPNSNRPTEHSTQLFLPPWWPNFWMTYKEMFPQYQSEAEAQRVIFTTKQFVNSSMLDVQDQIIDMLSRGNGGQRQPKKVQPNPVVWDV